jgi:hypothetical protein
MARPGDDPAGRWLGLLVFLLGVAFLVAVFAMAYRDLAGAGVLGQVTSPSAAAQAESALWTLAAKGVLLFLMSYVGSATAGRGIGLYAASRASHEL